MQEKVKSYHISGEDEKQNIRNTELTLEKSKRQNIIEHIKDIPLESTRFQACADSIDLTYERAQHNPNNIKLAMIEETIRQRKNSIPGYKKEFEDFSFMQDSYFNAMEETLRNTTEIPKAIYKGMVRSFPIRFARTLQDIKDQEIDKRNPPRQTG